MGETPLVSSYVHGASALELSSMTIGEIPDRTVRLRSAREAPACR